VPSSPRRPAGGSTSGSSTPGSAGDALAFDSSPAGVAAVKAAGIRCVAVPGDVTAGPPFDDAGLRIDSLAAVTLDQLLHPARPTAT
jgi:beta-phosphoglucomutase-like phosphatase (HAD superfamily)